MEELQLLPSCPGPSSLTPFDAAELSIEDLVGYGRFALRNLADYLQVVTDRPSIDAFARMQAECQAKRVKEAAETFRATVLANAEHRQALFAQLIREHAMLRHDYAITQYRARRLASELSTATEELQATQTELAALKAEVKATNKKTKKTS